MHNFLSDSTDRATLIRDFSGSVYGTNSQTLDRPISMILSNRIELYAPGKILYLTEDNGSVMKEWIDPRCLSDVKLSASAFTDHLPKNLTKMLEKVLKDEISDPTHVI